MFDSFTTTAYDYQGNPMEHETSNDSWSHTELCLTLSESYGYAETILDGKHYGEYGNRPSALGRRIYQLTGVGEVRLLTQLLPTNEVGLISYDNT